MLEYENQMMLDVLHEDGLLIAARGLGIEQVLMSLLYSFSDEGNLVIVLGTSNQEEEFLISEMQQKGITPLPKCVTADCPVNSRTQLYLKGGCLFVTSRILVVDLLMERVPAHLITGVIIWKAHKILESCQEAFILRLYRQRNKTGFIKALSSSPLSYTLGFCHVERVMKNLFVKKLYLWPRFHIQVSECFKKCEAEVVELHLQMTSDMKQIQMAALDLISCTLQELKLSNRAINIEEFCTENAISKDFEKMIKVQLDPIWHQLSTRTKQLLADLKVLRTILMFLTQYDSVTFYNLVNSLTTTEKAMQSAGWMLLPSAEVLILHAKARVYEKNQSSPTKKSKGVDGKEKKTLLSEVNPEVNPKWTALSEVLDEVQSEAKSAKETRTCLVITNDDRTSNQLTELLTDGANKVLKRNFYRSFGSKMGMAPPPFLFGKPESEKSRSLGMRIEKIGKRSKKTEKDGKEESEEVTLTQISRKYPLSGEEGNSGKTEGDSCGSSKSGIIKDGLSVIIHSLKDYNNPFKMNKILKEKIPEYILMYDCDLEFVRQVEVWQARNEDIKCRVYFLIYKGTVEEQIYLTNIKREKDAFEYLIKEKAGMVMPEYADGKHDDHPDLVRESPQEEKSANEITRKGAAPAEPPVIPRVIVDMREFRSELPSILHKRGIEIDPATIEVGDYILTPDICVERKSISDLIGSLNCGRLYNQAQSMTRYYRKPVLLIEFDHNKPFYLQGRLFLSSDASASPKDVSAKLQLLTLHFPHLCLLWSPSPYATAELFHMLKKEKPEPSVAEAQAVNSDSNPDFAVEKFNPAIKDFISKLPGVTSKNIFKILRNVKDLPHLLKMSLGELTELLENSKEAQRLCNALHDTISEPPPELDLRKGKQRTKFGKKPLKRGR